MTVALGNTWSHCVNTRLILQYVDGARREVLVELVMAWCCQVSLEENIVLHLTLVIRHIAITHIEA